MASLYGSLFLDDRDGLKVHRSDSDEWAYTLSFGYLHVCLTKEQFQKIRQEIEEIADAPIVRRTG